MANEFVVPKWAGKPPTGLHLDVYKEDKLIQKLMIDEKKCYFFGRNREINDFCIDHSSCSRVHAALLYHQNVSRTYLIDLASVHGTFIGSLRLDAQKPTPLPVDSSFSFGASTRRYVIRERPQNTIDEALQNPSEIELPETEVELENLTKFNTARNKKLEMLGAAEQKTAQKRKMRKGVSFNEEEEVINPEDLDPSVGKFQNLIQSSVIPGKKMRMETGLVPSTVETGANPTVPGGVSTCSSLQTPSPMVLSTFSASGFSLPNPAPDVEFDRLRIDSPNREETSEAAAGPAAASAGSTKKKYTKETWPGKKSFSDNFLDHFKQ